MRYGLALAALALAPLAAAQSPSPAPPAAPAASPAAGSIAAENNRLAAEVRKAIAGQEDKPAKEVFKNVTLMGDLPAGRLIAAMEGGLSRALGVSCTHCHDTTKWDADDKRPKKAARDMMKMVGTVNAQMKTMTNLEDANATVNCFMCHRGEVRPGANRRPAGAPPAAVPASPAPAPSGD